MNTDNILRKHCNKNSVILGVGGPSRHLYKVKMGARVYDLNINERDYKKSKRKYKRPLIIGSIFNAPFKDNTFDACFSSNVFEHLNEPWRAAEECVRVTKSGGLILLFTVFAWKYHDRPDYYRYSTDGIKYLFERTGKVITMKTNMIKIEKKKWPGWREYWRTYYYGVKK